MKKLILLSFVLLTALTTWADADIQSGSMLSLKNSDVRVLVVWDYSKMLIEDQKPDAFLKEKGPDWVRDYPAEVAAGESAFATQFNKKDKKYALITDDQICKGIDTSFLDGHHQRRWFYTTTHETMVVFKLNDSITFIPAERPHRKAKHIGACYIYHSDSS